MILPYRLNALHYFAITTDIVNVKICFENNVKFIKDTFGKHPLDYANESKNSVFIHQMIEIINTLTFLDNLYSNINSSVMLLFIKI